MRNPLFYYFCNENMKLTTKLGIAGCVAAAVAALVFFARPIYKALSPKPVEEGDLTEFPVRGIDISSHNGSVDFGRAASLGFRFVIMKASEGSDFKDAAFIDNIRRAREAGLKVGVYHFFRFDADGRMQALNLLHSVRGRRLDMPLVIDLEEWGNPNVATSAVVSRLETMLAALDDAGMSVMLYTNKDGYYRFVRGRFDRYPLWLCSFSEIDRSIPWTFWQYSHRGRIGDPLRYIDMNIFRGDTTAWNAWVASHPQLMQ